jgi:hypothetical protein
MSTSRMGHESVREHPQTRKLRSSAEPSDAGLPDLQRFIGNAAFTQLIGVIQRCGDHVSPG